MRLAQAFLGVGLVALLSLLPAPARADNVAAGFDLFQTDPSQTYQDFTGPFTIPPSFFDPGSDPFTGRVQFQGVPLQSSPFCPTTPLGPTDTVVRRGGTSGLGGGGTEIVPIELVQLSLVSVSPITVTYGGGGNPELWDVGVTVSPTLPSTGTMTIRHQFPGGGTFDSQLNVYPLLTFRRLSDNAVRQLDAGQFGLADQLFSTGVMWSHSSGGVPCPNCSENFYPGSATELAQLAAHGVIPLCPNDPTSARGRSWGGLKVIYR